MSAPQDRNIDTQEERPSDIIPPSSPIHHPSSSSLAAPSSTLLSSTDFAGLRNDEHLFGSDNDESGDEDTTTTTTNTTSQNKRRRRRRDDPYSDDASENEPVSEEDGEELIHENMTDDYRHIEELDRYESDGLTDEEIDDDVEARIEAERDMRRRDRQNAQRGELPMALAAFDDDDTDAVSGRPRRRRRTDMVNTATGDYNATMLGLADDDTVPLIDLRNIQLQDNTIFENADICYEIRRVLRNFVRSYGTSESGIAPYIQRINTMCEDNAQSYELLFSDLSVSLPEVSMLLIEYPEKVIKLFSEEIASIVNILFPGYNSLHSVIAVRIRDFPLTESIRHLRQINLNKLVRVSGVAVRRTAVFPQIAEAYYKCKSCFEITGPDDGSLRINATLCRNCQKPALELDKSRTIFQNYQKITLQEPPGSVPAGRIPRQKDIIVLQDLIDSCAPGEEIDVTGVYKHSYDASLNRLNSFPVFSTVIIANHIQRKDASSTSAYSATDDDIREIIQLSKKHNIAELIVNSIAPSIYGHKHIKTAIAYSLFGGEAKEFENKHRLRGDINVLLLGDPGTAKSQFLKYVEKTSQRAVYTTGKGASAVGLTASVRNDPITREWTLEGGALVLADQGVCLIDEFDKMGDQDRTSIHEAMEQQSISISKAGIVCTLRARCSVIAAANPISGRYVNTLSFQEQVDLTEPILSRFDCFCIVRDIPDREIDRKLAEFVTNSHRNAHPIEAALRATEESIVYQTRERRREEARVLLEKGQIPQDILRKYISYAKKTCHPRLLSVDDRLIVDLYTDLRKRAQASGGIQITSRQIESLIRMAEAHAKMHLRDIVTKADVDAAIDTMLESFLSSQKLSARSVLEPQFAKYRRRDEQRYRLLLDRLRVDVENGVRYRQLLHRVDYNVAISTPIEIPITKFVDWAKTIGIVDLRAFFISNEFQSNGYTINDEKGLIVHTFNHPPSQQAII